MSSASTFVIDVLVAEKGNTCNGGRRTLERIRCAFYERPSPPPSEGGTYLQRVHRAEERVLRQLVAEEAAVHGRLVLDLPDDRLPMACVVRRKVDELGLHRLRWRRRQGEYRGGRR